jgi:hypothetical protein
VEEALVAVQEDLAAASVAVVSQVVVLAEVGNVIFYVVFSSFYDFFSNLEFGPFIQKF